MAVTEIKYTIGFSDDTKQDITIGPFKPGSGLNAKDRIIEFNRNFNSDTAKLMVSKYGNEWTGITRAQLITTEVTAFF